MMQNPEAGIAGDSMFREHILDHYRNPRNSGTLEKCDGKNRGLNPLCGDEICIQVSIENKRIKNIKFQGNGCAISQASASILTEEVMGKPLEDVKKLDRNAMLAMIGIDVAPARIKCAVLGLKVLEAAVKEAENGKS